MNHKKDSKRLGQLKRWLSKRQAIAEDDDQGGSAGSGTFDTLESLLCYWKLK